MNIQEILTPWLKNLHTASDVSASETTTNSIDLLAKIQEENKVIRKQNKQYENQLKRMLSEALVLDDILVLNIDWGKAKSQGLTQKHKKLFFSPSWEDKALQD